MIEFGKTLREARERKGLTIPQLAETTRLLKQIVEDLEKENFNRIAAPIYGRGFIKLYCTAVDIDPKPLIEEYMAIINGEREVSIRMRDSSAPALAKVSAPKPPPPPPQLKQMPTPEPPKRDYSLPGFSGEIGINYNEENYHAETIPSAEVIAARKRAFHFPGKNYEESFEAKFIMPSINWFQFAKSHSRAIRLITLIAVVAIVIFLIFSGIRSLYRIMMTPPSSETVATASTKVVEAAPANDVESATKRQPINIPPLYID